MPKFVAVIGQRNSGKSSIVKSLTGCPQSAFRDIVYDRTTGRSIYVICSSPQEQPFTLAQLKTAIAKCRSTPNCQGIVIAIQPTFPRKRLSLEDIFQELAISAQFQSFAFVLDPGYDGASAGYNNISKRISNYPSYCASLDGQRFAQVNAEIINSVTQIAS